MRRMTFPVRLALAIGVGFLIAAGVATFLPTTTSGPCGTWVTPEWTPESAASTAAKFDDFAVKFEKAGATADADRARLNAQTYGNVYAACSEPLTTRRNVTV